MIQLEGSSCIIFSLTLVIKLVKMCLNEAYSRVRVGKHLSDVFPIRNGLKQGGALWPLLFNFASEYAIRRVQVNQTDIGSHFFVHLN